MKKIHTTRREMLASMALGSSAAMIGVTTDVLADEHEIPSLGPEEVQNFHTKLLDMTGRALDGQPALSEYGLMQTLDALRQADLIDGTRLDDTSDYSIIGRLISMIWATADDWSEQIRDFYDAVVEGLQDVAKTVAATCMASVEYAMQRCSELDIDIIKVVVAHDVRGAMDGARFAATLGLPQFAVYGAVMGGTACSVIGYFDHIQRRTICE